MGSTTCSDDYLMVSCSAWSAFHAFDGAYVGSQWTATVVTSNTTCVSKADGTPFDATAFGTRAHGVCCKYTGSDGYELQCDTKWGSAASDGGTSTIGCDSGYAVMGCSGYSTFRDSL